MAWLGWRRIALVLVSCLGLVLLCLPRTAVASVLGAASSASGGASGLSSTGDPAPPLPSGTSSDDGPLAPMDADTEEDSAAVSAAVRQADSSGRPVTVPALTTATNVTVADPGGEVTVRENVLPVRVRHGGSWVPVSTALERAADGALSPAAVPGDTVTFSGGGTGRLATLSAAGTSLSLSWPGRLPIPVVSASSATYRDVLPGVSLVLTATAAETGGFEPVIVISSAAAARNPEVARLRLAVAASGVTLREAPGGGLEASGSRSAGYYSAPASLMWDSSSSAAGAGSAAAKAAARVGASLAPPGLSGPRSTRAGPARGARVARVGTAVAAGCRTLSLVPDAALLASKSTVFPVYIDPSFSWSTAGGSRMNYDEVQSACPTASQYDTTDSAYWSLGVGYDGFGDCEGYNGYAYSYYEIKVPPQIWGGYLNSATINAQEAYTASCSASADVTLSWTGGINSGTDWANKPGSNEDVVTNNVGPGPSDSCNSSYDTSSGDWKGVGFNVLPVIDKAAGGWSNFTFRLWENGDSNDVDWKRFGKNPSLQVTYDQEPNTPYGLQISTGGAGSDCTAAPYPWVGRLSSGGTTMSAVVSVKTGVELEGIFEYKANSSSAWTTVDSTSTAVTSGTPAKAVIPYSFTNGLADGTEVDWRVEADDGAPSGDKPDSSWSAECHLYADPSDPPAPTVTAGFTSDPVAGSQVSFTIASSDPSTDPATEFVWGLDDVPSSSSPPPAQVISLKGATSAKVTIPHVPGPGPHALYAYAKDAAGNDSQWSGSSDPATFSASADSNDSYSSLAVALAAGQPFDNKMISSSATESGTADADGAGNSFSSANLEAAGWEPGGTVTADGATFKLPDFGSGSPDNILAANQTIDLPPGSQGTSLVFLVAATNANAAAPDAPDLPAGDVTAPYVRPGSRVVQAQCDSYQAGLDDSPCFDPESQSGVITYSSSSTATPESYYLTVPDWVSGPAGPAAIEFPDRNTATGTVADGPKIYAFSVPLNPSAAVASVTLPDVGSALSALGGSTDGRDSFAALHVLGIAVANTTTATPGSATPLASGQAWTGAWASPTEGAYAPVPGDGSSFSDETFRIATPVSAGGSAVRLRLSDDLGWLAGASGKPLDIGHVTVAAQDSGAAVSGTAVTATFGGGSESVTIPEGGDVYSDPVALTVTPGEDLSVSIYLSNSVPYLVQHSMCSACTEYVTASGAGDQTLNTDGTPYSGTGTVEGQFTDILTGVDVETSGTPTAAVLGDGLIDAMGADTTPPLQAARVSDDLATALQSAAGAGNEPAFGVVGEGIESNRMLTDTDTTAAGTGGPSTMSRLASDILAEPGVGTAVVDEGLEDLLQAGDSSDIEGDLTDNGYNELISQLGAWGITVILATMTPCSGYAGSGSSPEDACTTGTAPTVDASRTDINSGYLIAQYGNQACPLGPCVDAVDFDGAVTNGASPEALAPADAGASGDKPSFDSGDHVNLTDAGYAAATATIPLSDLMAASPPGY